MSAAPPALGDVLAATLAQLGMSQAALARATGLTTKHVNQIIKYHVHLTANTAVRLERATGIPALAWLSIDAQHQVHQIQSTANAVVDSDVDESAPVELAVKLADYARTIFVLRNLSALLNETRERHNLTYREMSAESGVPLMTLHRFAHSRGHIFASTAVALLRMMCTRSMIP